MTRVERDPCCNCGSLLTSALRRRIKAADLVEVYTVCSICYTETIFGLTTDRLDSLKLRRAKLQQAVMRQEDRTGYVPPSMRSSLDEVERAIAYEALLHGI